MKFFRFSFGLIVLFFCFLAFGCDVNQVFEKNYPIKGKEWAYADTIGFTVPILDTASRYNIYLNVRHSQQYSWQNLWVIMHTHFPSGTRSNTRIDLPLADKTGKWYGRCTGDICHAQIPIQMNAVFPDTGRYSFFIEQNMRENPLLNVLGMGMRIERSPD